MFCNFLQRRASFLRRGVRFVLFRVAGNAVVAMDRRLDDVFLTTTATNSVFFEARATFGADGHYFLLSGVAFKAYRAEYGPRGTTVIHRKTNTERGVGGTPVGIYRPTGWYTRKPHSSAGTGGVHVDRGRTRQVAARIDGPRRTDTRARVLYFSTTTTTTTTTAMLLRCN